MILKSGDEKKIVEKTNKYLEDYQRIAEYSQWPEKDFPRTMTMKIDRNKVYKFVVEKKPIPEEGIKESGDKLAEIISKVCDVEIKNIIDDKILYRDLDMDSIRRVLLISMIEDEFGVYVDEENINQETTVSQLREIIKHSKPEVVDSGLVKWPFSEPAVFLRKLLQKNFVFPVFGTFAKIEIENPENLKLIENPSIIVYNHVGQFDAVAIVKILPEKIRGRIAAATADYHWKNKIYIPLLYLLFNTFKFTRSGTGHNFTKGGVGIKSSLERVGELINKGWTIIIAPEGETSVDGKMIAFKGGAGFIATNMNVPVVPFKIEGYHEIYPRFHTLPVKRGKVLVKIGKPFKLPKGISHIEATELIRKEVEQL